ncbi:MAG: DUF262 domain-containing protein [Kiritimatiellae bacterium]|nr:DUF262 domain-containing protein [Kiritimatiellia bacterium]
MSEKTISANLVDEIILVNEDGSNALFGTDPARYVVPVYQRAFAWGSGNSGKKQNEILQLIDDVLAAKETYYLGSLVVSKCRKDECSGPDVYEVIDGQQRLTALYVIFACLGLKVNAGSLGYACREASQSFLEKLAEWPGDGDPGWLSNVSDEKDSAGIQRGVHTVLEKLHAEYGEQGVEQYKSKLREAFKRVRLFRIEVPEGTDLNRYFEIMNTRGEQLEQQDIVKADLLSRLENNQQRAVFAEVWDACNDMDGYVQMHFNGEHEKKGTLSRRELLFMEDWSKCPEIDWAAASPAGNDDDEKLEFEGLVDKDVDEVELKDDGETYKNARFESVIDFPHFLLHVLKVFNAAEHLGQNLQEQTDTMNMRREFMKVFPPDGCSERVQKFAQCLLKCRFYFDKYILKREFNSIRDEGAWSLKELAKSEGKNESAYYRSTQNGDVPYAGHEKLKMIEACLRVSYTNPKVMHWITNLLYWIYKNGEGRMDEFLAYVQGVARLQARKFIANRDYNQGVQTPNIVLNYLDYLLWEQKSQLASKQGFAHLFDKPFEFEFRNSVEHWYPQHPDADADGCPEWGAMDNAHGVVDRFGNLALLQSNINAHFSNQPPRGKCGYETTKSGSVKLRIMAILTESAENNEMWYSSICEEHEQQMLNVLRTDCVNYPTDVTVLWGDMNQ